MTTPTLRPILERLAYATYMMMLIGSLCGVLVSVIMLSQTGRLDLLLLTLGMGAVARWLHLHGQAHWHFRTWAASLDAAGSGVLSGSEQAEFLALLVQFEAEPELWRRQELRRALGEKLARKPALRGEFAALLAAHPDL